MPVVNTNRKLSQEIIRQDIDALNGLGTIVTYDTSRSEATSEALQAAYQRMLLRQQVETERRTQAKIAADEARSAEWDFHQAILAMKEAVRGQFGSDSNESIAVGLKKKSARKRPTRAKVTASSSDLQVLVSDRPTAIAS